MYRTHIVCIHLVYNAQLLCTMWAITELIYYLDDPWWSRALTLKWFCVCVCVWKVIVLSVINLLLRRVFRTSEHKFCLSDWNVLVNAPTVIVINFPLQEIQLVDSAVQSKCTVMLGEARQSSSSNMDVPVLCSSQVKSRSFSCHFNHINLAKQTLEPDLLSFLFYYIRMVS